MIIHQHRSLVDFIAENCFYRCIGPELRGFATVFAIDFTPVETRRDDSFTIEGIPVEVMTTLIGYYIANRQDDTDWVVLPVANFDAYFGRSFSHLWLNKLPEDTIVRERDKGRGVCRYQLGLEKLRGKHFDGILEAVFTSV